MNDWKKICRVQDIPALGARRIARPGEIDVAVFRGAGDRVFALLDRCPHKGGPLSQGIVFGESVACPLHNWTIELASGAARAPDQGCTTRFSVRVEADEVFLDLVELKTLGIGVSKVVAGPAAAGVMPIGAATAEAERPQV